MHTGRPLGLQLGSGRRKSHLQAGLSSVFRSNGWSLREVWPSMESGDLPRSSWTPAGTSGLQSVCTEGTREKPTFTERNNIHCFFFYFQPQDNVGHYTIPSHPHTERHCCPLGPPSTGRGAAQGGAPLLPGRLPRDAYGTAETGPRERQALRQSHRLSALLLHVPTDQYLTILIF